MNTALQDLKDLKAAEKRTTFVQAVMTAAQIGLKDPVIAHIFVQQQVSQTGK